MSVQVQRVEKTSKEVELAKFTPESLATAIKTGKTFVCGWSHEREVDDTTRIILQARIDGENFVIGDGWARTKPHTHDDRFGERFPYTTILDDVRLIADPYDFLPPISTTQNGTISRNPESTHRIRAGETVIMLDRLWVEGKLTDDIKIINSWELQ